MNLKHIGGITMLVFSVYFGFCKIAEMKLRIGTLEALIALTAHIRRRIDCFCEPLTSIYASFDNDLFGKVGAKDALVRDGISAAADVLTALTDAERRDLLKFEAKLAEYYPADAIKLCDAELERLGEVLDAANADYAPKAKLYKTLPPLGAVALILLMI